MDWHIIDPDKARILSSTAVGSFVTLILTRKNSWVFALTLFVVGLASSWFFTIPLAVARGWGPAAYQPIGFLIGMFAMMFWGGVILIAQAFSANPETWIARALAIWRGGAK